MEQFLNEALLSGKGITLSDALSVGGMVTGVGISIVFAVLVILMLVLMLFKVIFYKAPKTEAKSEKAPEVSVSTPNTIDDGELIAVLTAAIAASLNTSTYNLKIKSYRRVGDSKPSWRKAGISETINNRF